MATKSQDNIQALVAEISELSNQKNGTDPNTELKLLAKAKGLVSALSARQTPEEHSMSMVWPVVESSTIRTLMHFGVLNTIPHDGSIQLKELESATGAQAALLERLLRVVVGSGFIIQHPDGSYAHSTLSAGYNGDVASIFKVVFDELSVLTALPNYFDAHSWKEPDGEKSKTHNPSTWYRGQEGKTVFELIGNDPEKSKDFQKLMKFAQRYRPYTGYYDFGKLRTGEEGRPVLVDLGAGDGMTIAKILEAHPEIKPEQCVVEDLPQVIEVARKNKELPNGVQFKGHNFFEPQPVKNARAYLVRAVLHDWSDQTTVQILKNIAPAMSDDSKLLIGDNITPETGANEGIAAFADLWMMSIGGKERTKRDFEAVLDAAGLKLDGIYPAGNAENFAILEASLK